MKHNYVVYRYVSPSGKSYIGQTCQGVSVRAGKNGYSYRSCPVFYDAIKHYGWKWFEQHREILAENLSHDEADELEHFYIDKYHSLVPNGYNVQTGGTYNTRELFIKPVIGINCFTKEIKYYDSVTDAANSVGTNTTKISRVALHRGNYKTAAGYVWMYFTEYNQMPDNEKDKIYSIMPAPHSKQWSKYFDIVRLNDGKKYDTMKEAAQDNHIYSTSIGKCLRGELNFSGYMDDGSPIHWARQKKVISNVT